MKLNTAPTTHALRFGVLRNFMSVKQRNALATMLYGEEGQFVIDKVSELLDIIATMPKSYQTDGLGDDAMVQLHYFGATVDAWITEKDMGEDGSGNGVQHQAFGKVTLTGDKADAELGYISIKEFLDFGLELDLHWDKKALKDI